jgi:hypothetical protein
MSTRKPATSVAGYFFVLMISRIVWTGSAAEKSPLMLKAYRKR